MKRKPIYEYTDKRMSDEYALFVKKLQKARDKAAELMGNNYFTNKKEIVNEQRINNWKGNTNQYHWRS